MFAQNKILMQPALSYSSLKPQIGFDSAWRTCYDTLFPADGVVFDWDSTNRRWAVRRKQLVICDATAHQSISTDTAEHVVATYALPGGLIGDGEEWVIEVFADKTSASGNDQVRAVLGGAGITPSMLVTSSGGSIARNSFVRRGATIRRYSTAWSGNNIAGSDAAVDLSGNVTLDVRITSATLGDISFVNRVQLYRNA